LTQFNSHSGKALLLKTQWELFSDFFERITPNASKDELWLTTGRINEVWQSAFDDKRKPYINNRFPDTWVEIHPTDAKKYGIESGDIVHMTNDDVLIQTGGWIRVKGYKFGDLVKDGLISQGKGEADAVAVVTEDVRPGVLFTNFLHPSSPANSLAHRVPDPFANVYRFKLGKARIKKIGESPYKKSFEEMTFKPRTVSG
jgi:arsenite oxidase large subunit